MHTVLEFLLTNAVATTILAAGVFCISRLIRRPAVIHALWVLVLLKLVTPSVSSLPVGVSIDRSLLWESTAGTHDATEANAAESPNAGSHVGTQAVPQSDLAASRFGADTAHVAAGDVTVPAGSVAEVPEAAAHHLPTTDADMASTAMQVWAITVRGGVVLWCLVSTALVLNMIRCYVRFRRHLDQFAEVDTDVIGESFDLAWQMGIRRPPQVRVLSGTMSPMLYGVGTKATMVLPHDLLRRLSPSSRATLIAHELAHFRRGDTWVRLLEAIATVVFWWHPVVWIARRQIESAEEECCDAWVVSMFPTVPRSYAEALLDTIDFLNERPQLLPPLACGLGPAHLLRRRLTLIMKGVAPKNAGIPGTLLLTCLATVALMFQPLVFQTRAAESRWVLSWRDRDVDFGAVAGAATAEAAADRRDIDANDAADSRRTSRVADMDRRRELSGQSHNHNSATPWVSAASFDGRVLLQVSADRSASLVATGTEYSNDIPPDWVRCAAFAGDGRRVAIGGKDGFVRVLDTATASIVCQRQITSADVPVSSIDWSHDGATIVAAAEDGHLWLLNADDGSVRLTTDRTSLHISCVRFSADDRTIAVICGHWSVPNQATLSLLNTFDLTVHQQALTERPLGAVVFSDRTDRLLLLDWNGQATVVNSDLSEPTTVLPIAKDDVSSIAFSAQANVAELLSGTF